MSNDWNEEDHPRDGDGKFTKGESLMDGRGETGSQEASGSLKMEKPGGNKEKTYVKPTSIQQGDTIIFEGRKVTVARPVEYGMGSKPVDALVKERGKSLEWIEIPKSDAIEVVKTSSGNFNGREVASKDIWKRER